LGDLREQTGKTHLVDMFIELIREDRVGQATLGKSD
jgi:hypothetical protein